MDNIFKSAYFGKLYKTNTDEKAVYLGEDLGDFKYKLAYQILSDITNKLTYTILECDEIGCSKTDVDIVSEWQEKIDEEKLDKLAEEYSNYSTESESSHSLWSGLKVGFKAGYRKAKEE